MSKSVLIINTPSKCATCPLKDNMGYCSISERYEKVKDIQPEWCPLNEISEKIHNIYLIASKADYLNSIKIEFGVRGNW